MYGIDVTDVADAAAVRVGTASEPAAASNVLDALLVADAIAARMVKNINVHGALVARGANYSIVVTLVVAVSLVLCSEDKTNWLTLRRGEFVVG